MAKYIAILIASAALLVGSNVYAGGNPGRNAMRCLDVSSSGDKVNFRNTCNKQIFVVWCGDLKYSNKNCGDGPRGHFYTQSANIDPGDVTSTVIQRGGRYQYAACEGRISFGTDGIEAPARDNGRFRCTPTGSYR